MSSVILATIGIGYFLGGFIIFAVIRADGIPLWRAIVAALLWPIALVLSTILYIFDWEQRDE